MLGKAIKKKIAYCLCGIMIFATGCGSEILEAPKLNKPVAINESYRPVEKGDVGDIKIYSGAIVPTDYCHFYTTSIKVAEIKVHPYYHEVCEMNGLFLKYLLHTFHS